MVVAGDVVGEIWPVVGTAAGSVVGGASVDAVVVVAGDAMPLVAVSPPLQAAATSTRAESNRSLIGTFG
jgi:hypothetical protein